MTMPQYSKNILFLTLGIMFLSGCSRDPVTDLKQLEIASGSCFQASFSLAKSRYPNDFDKMNADFSHEMYRCMVWKVEGSDVKPDRAKELSDIFKKSCPFDGLQNVIRDDMIACLTETATPMILENAKAQ